MKRTAALSLLFPIFAILTGAFIGRATAQTDDMRVKAEISVVQLPASEADTPLIVEIRLTIPEDQNVYADADHFFEVQTETGDRLGSVQIELPEITTIENPFSEPPDNLVKVFAKAENIIHLTAPVRGESGESWQIEGTVQWQACSDTLCYPPSGEVFSFSGQIGDRQSSRSALRQNDSDKRPQPVSQSEWAPLAERYEITAQAVGYKGKDSFLTFLEKGRAGKEYEGFFGDLGTRPLWVAVALILMGGFLLNFTPCVLPMIPINLAIIGAGAQAGSKSRGLALGAMYGLGIALAYGMLGLLVVLTGEAFGTINSNPWFNLGIAVLFAVLSLAVLGIFNIDLSSLGSKLNTEKWRTGSFAVAFIMGGISALLAGACVAPIVIAVLVLAADRYAEGSNLALLYPFLLGLGMAIPWPFTGAGLSFLPKPGGWMNYVKYIFGVLILGLAVYYGWTAYKLFTPSRVSAAPSEQVDKTPPADGLDWYRELVPALEDGLETGKPVLIDFWASWCKNCHAMDRTTLSSATVVKELEKFVLVKYQAEDLSATRHKPILEYFNVLGLPTYVILKPE